MPHWVPLAAAVALVLGAGAARGADANHTRSLAASCANCHGTHGRAREGMEPLAGRPRDAILRSLLDFKTGKRPATIMHQLSKGYSDEELARIAAFYAAQKPQEAP